MSSKVIVPVLSIFLLSACMVAPRHGGGLEVIPILPVVVEIGSDDYYTHDGYHYYHTNDRWYYSSSRDGRRSELPRSHWPRETRRRGGDYRR